VHYLALVEANHRGWRPRCQQSRAAAAVRDHN
jgi:hypothetical protein